MNIDLDRELTMVLKNIHLPIFRQYYSDCATMAMKESWPYQQYLLELARREYEARRCNTIERLLKSSRLPREKTMASFDLKRLPIKIVGQIRMLADGAFMGRSENILAFGKPGSGKTHLLCALCHELIQQGHRIYFTSCDLLVQQLLRAKRDLELDKILKRLSKYEAIMIDDFGYVKQDREEMEVLFTLLAQRYEQGSVLITSNLPFSQWESIFKDPMTTAAAIDRLVHHSVILELNVSSYRAEKAMARKEAEQ
jgi:DNA replication protein DnaC